MLELYTKLCKDIEKSFDKDGISVTLQKYFQFPEKSDLLYVICVKLKAILLKPGVNTEFVVRKVYAKLRNILDNPDILKVEDSDTSTKDFINLLTTSQLSEYSTTSVKYVDGKLMYCVKQPIEEMLFSKEMFFDKHTTYQQPLRVLRQLLKNYTDEDSINKLKDRSKVLKKIAKVAAMMDTSKGFVTIDRQGDRLKSSIQTKADVTYLLIN